MILFTLLRDTGSHLAGWRHPDAYAGGLHRFDYYRDLARTAERGKLDAVFFADTVGFRHIAGRDAFSRTDQCRLEPLTLLGALSQVTERIGLVATASTSFSQPYTIARMFATLDHLSAGRVGWNVVTSSGENEAHNHGLAEHLGHSLRYERAAEFVDVVRDLWDSWEDDAFLIDKASGRYFDPAKVHALGHSGTHFAVEGPLNIRRPVQGQPVIVQAGSSDTGRAFAAQHADVIFTIPVTLEAARDFRAAVRADAERAGHAPPRVLPAIHAIVGETEAAALARFDQLGELIDPELSLSVLQMLLGGVDLSGYDIDGPLPDIPETEVNQTTRRILVDRAAREGLSIRRLAQQASVGRGAMMLAGTPAQIADRMQHWFEGGAADGFVVSHPFLPTGLDEFVDHVIPELQRRGLFRREYATATLRDHLGLPRPENRFLSDPARHREPEIWR